MIKADKHRYHAVEILSTQHQLTSTHDKVIGSENKSHDNKKKRAISFILCYLDPYFLFDLSHHTIVYIPSQAPSRQKRTLSGNANVNVHSNLTLPSANNIGNWFCST